MSDIGYSFVVEKDKSRLFEHFSYFTIWEIRNYQNLQFSVLGGASIRS